MKALDLHSENRVDEFINWLRPQSQFIFKLTLKSDQYCLTYFFGRIYHAN